MTSIISDPTQDPHSYEADPQNQLALSKADVVIENGGGYDDFMDTMLKRRATPTPTVLNVVDISGFTARPDGELNEHVWYDFPTDARSSSTSSPPRWPRPIRRTRRRFTRQRRPRSSTRLQRAAEAEAAIAAAHSRCRACAVTEPVPLYLLDACGWSNKTPAEFSEADRGGHRRPAARAASRRWTCSAREQVALLAYNEQTRARRPRRCWTPPSAHGVPVVPVTETLPGRQGLRQLDERQPGRACGRPWR